MNIVFVLIGILVILVLMAMGIYNKYIKLKNLNEEALERNRRIFAKKAGFDTKSC